MMIIRISEEEGEDLSGRVGKVFEYLGAKPVMELSIVGKLVITVLLAPIKMEFSSAATRNLIMVQAQKQTNK